MILIKLLNSTELLCTYEILTVKNEDIVRVADTVISLFNWTEHDRISHMRMKLVRINCFEVRSSHWSWVGLFE